MVHVSAFGLVIEKKNGIVQEIKNSPALKNGVIQSFRCSIASIIMMMMK